MMKFDIKKYARSFHEDEVTTGHRVEPEKVDGLSWRDISARQVAIDGWKYRDEPTVITKQNQPTPVVAYIPKAGYVYYVGDGNGRIKIGFSVNPWSRVKEMRCFNPSVEILATEKAQDGFALERERHQQFKQDHLALEWFKASEKLWAHITELKNRKE